jgi:branched-subunit amino acid ABC-type transport system permease component
MALYIQQFFNGITLGSLYALIAIGYTMVYGILRFINFAHGDIFMFAGYWLYLGVYVAALLRGYDPGRFITGVGARGAERELIWGVAAILAVVVTAAMGFLSSSVSRTGRCGMPPAFPCSSPPWASPSFWGTPSSCFPTGGPAAGRSPFPVRRSS